MVRPKEDAEIQPLWEAYDPRPVVIHIDPSFDDPEAIEWKTLYFENW
jgi:hypothetical protein